MTPEQAIELKSLIAAMKEAQLKAFGANASKRYYDAWITATEKVEQYINLLIT